LRGIGGDDDGVGAEPANIGLLAGERENSVTSAPDASPGYRMRHPTAAASSDADTRSQVVKVATALGCTSAPMIGGAG
jgi:hypothetical protein